MRKNPKWVNMGVGCSSPSLSSPTHQYHHSFPLATIACDTKQKSNFSFNPINKDRIFNTHYQKVSFFPLTQFSVCGLHSRVGNLKCGSVKEMETHQGIATKEDLDLQSVDQDLVQKMVYDALVWSSLHGLVVGDRSVQVKF